MFHFDAATSITYGSPVSADDNEAEPAERLCHFPMYKVSLSIYLMDVSVGEISMLSPLS